MVWTLVHQFQCIILVGDMGIEGVGVRWRRPMPMVLDDTSTPTASGNNKNLNFSLQSIRLEVNLFFCSSRLPLVR